MGGGAHIQPADGTMLPSSAACVESCEGVDTRQGSGFCQWAPTTRVCLIFASCSTGGEDSRPDFDENDTAGVRISDAAGDGRMRTSDPTKGGRVRKLVEDEYGGLRGSVDGSLYNTGGCGRELCCWELEVNASETSRLLSLASMSPSSL